MLSHLHISAAKNLVNVEGKLRAAIESIVHLVDDHMHSDLTQLVEQHTCEVASRNSPGSFPHVFSEQQLEVARQKDSCGMRWHPLLIKWAIYLHYHSSGACDMLRSSVIIQLPSQRTLRGYTHYFQAKVKFSEEGRATACESS